VVHRGARKRPKGRDGNLSGNLMDLRERWQQL
jgi:hypothetical protein